MRSRLSPVVHADRLLTAAELSSARLDGELVAIGAAFQFIDLPDSTLARAASLAPALHDSRAIVSERTAAWVWGWLPECRTVSTCVSIAARLPSTARRLQATREVVIRVDEVAQLGGVRVTTPLRTVVDLARLDADDAVVDIIATALSTNGVGEAELRGALERSRSVSHIARARRRVGLALSRC
ncbi:MAG: hypothetical protein KIT89_02990 [Microcella sp.]|uniref:hypothetical protein n=1 Tax=Microcella sp. TaxID=1913979 RepID=UPI0024CD2B49|nr:hypothetical protein [Microcella sp.]UYN84189.1 MAG: hypothetical protein KIT89_02990 [Microcella sp.]